VSRVLKVTRNVMKIRNKRQCFIDGGAILGLTEYSRASLKCRPRYRDHGVPTEGHPYNCRDEFVNDHLLSSSIGFKYL
jgi:hypothetical protein